MFLPLNMQLSMVSHTQCECSGCILGSMFLYVTLCVCHGCQSRDAVLSKEQCMRKRTHTADWLLRVRIPLACAQHMIPSPNDGARRTGKSSCVFMVGWVRPRRWGCLQGCLRGCLRGCRVYTVFALCLSNVSISVLRFWLLLCSSLSLMPVCMPGTCQAFFVTHHH